MFLQFELKEVVGATKIIEPEAAQLWAVLQHSLEICLTNAPKEVTVVSSFKNSFYIQTIDRRIMQGYRELS